MAATDLSHGENLSETEPGKSSRRLTFLNDALEHAWTRGWFDRPAVHPDALIAAATRSAGLDDFGAEQSWRERLERLTESIGQEAQLSAVGVTTAYGQIVAALAGRLRAASLWRRHPEIAQVPLSAPIIIIGQMRSGSTRMQRLLACDPQFAFTRFFESWNPVPRWSRAVIDDRKWRAWLALKVAHLLNPKFRVIHPSKFGQADEEIGLHNIALYGAAFEAQWRIPGFARYAEMLDTGPIYAEFRRHLQTIKWLRGARDDRPWILKLPQFAQDLDTVVQTFPDARIIMLHRDPVPVVGSSASLVYNQMSAQSDHVDRHWIGQEWLGKVRLRERRVAEARMRHDLDAVDVWFSAMAADWRTEMAKVYAFLGRPFTRDVERRMAKFMRNRDHTRLTGHHYDVADFGLTANQIRTALARDGSLPASRCSGASTRDASVANQRPGAVDGSPPSSALASSLGT